jgi:HK97 family phage major capsid protein
MNKYQKRMDEAFKKMEEIRKKAEAESRALTAEELEQRAALKAEIDQAKREWDDFKAEEELRTELYGTGSGAVTLEDPNAHPITGPDQPIYRGSNATALGMQLADIRMISDPKFDGKEVRDARSRLEQSQKRYVQRLVTIAQKENRAAATGGFTVGVPTDGGMFLQGETVVDLMTNGFNNSAILPKMAKRTLTATQFIEIIGIDEKSRKDGSRGGGIRVYTDKELGTVDASKTQLSKIRIEPKKLTGIFYASEEWSRNVTFMGQEVRGLFGEEFAFKCQNLAIRGSGAGEGLGALNADCLVTVAKENGQTAGTIKTDNLSKMWARFNGRNPAWFINRDCGPQLDQLSIAVGTAALEPRFVTYDAQGILRIKGAPVVEIEQCETVGTVGDIILADWSQYVAADQGDINEAMSIHVNFIYGQNTYRFTYYFDCQPRWSSAIHPFKGSNTVSPIVALATR